MLLKLFLSFLMLKGISPLISPELLFVLSRMGHGDEIVLADAHFPAESCNQRVLRADGLRIAELLRAIAPLFPLDEYAEAPLVMMDAVAGDVLNPEVERSYRQSLGEPSVGELKIARLERYAFYDRSRTAFAVVQTGETAQYGNIILKKGIVR